GRRSRSPARLGHGERPRPSLYVVGRYLTAFFRPAPGVNFGTREAAILIFSPVAGLRPSRALRLLTLNFPNPEKTTSLPRLRVLSIVSRTASTASAASLLLSPARSATWSTNSAFVTCSPPWRSRASRT